VLLELVTAAGSSGGRNREIRVWLRLDQLRAYGLAAQDGFSQSLAVEWRTCRFARGAPPVGDKSVSCGRRGEGAIKRNQAVISGGLRNHSCPGFVGIRGAER